MIAATTSSATIAGVDPALDAVAHERVDHPLNGSVVGAGSS
jgi:hypothetical protein